MFLLRCHSTDQRRGRERNGNGDQRLVTRQLQCIAALPCRRMERILLQPFGSAPRNESTPTTSCCSTSWSSTSCNLSIAL